MKRIVVGCYAITLSVAAACSGTGTDTNAPASGLALTMASSFSTVPAGYTDLNSSFVGDMGGSFVPEFGPMSHDGRGPGGPGGFGGPGFGLGFMGGGLFGGFFGDGFGRGFAPTDTSCHFASSTGIITCGPHTHDGLTVSRTIQFQTASGQSQSAFDTTTTNSVTTKITVSGTSTRRDGDQSTISSSSNQSVSGLAKGSTSHTVNSTSASTENTTGTSSQGAFTAKRAASDAVKGVVIPVSTSTNRFPYPTAGSITRSMSSTVQITGQTATTSSRTEVITYDGSATAKVVITQDGVTQNCTLPLPHGRLTCS
jgi:hypothetical protein